MPEGEDLRQWHALIGTDSCLSNGPQLPVPKLHHVNSISMPLPNNHLQVSEKAQGIGHRL